MNALAASVIERSRVCIPCFNPSDTDFDWSAIPVLATLSPNEPVKSPGTQVRACATDKALHVRCDCLFHDASQITPLVPYEPIGTSEHVALAVYAANDSSVAHVFRGEYRGLKDASIQRTSVGEARMGDVYDTWSDTKPITGEWDRLHGLGIDHWWIEFILPWRVLGLQTKPGVIGLHLSRLVQDDELPHGRTTAHWPEGHTDTVDAVIEGIGGAPASIDLGSPRFGVNQAKVTLGNDWPSRPTKLIARMGEIEQSVDIVGDTATIDYTLDRADDQTIDRFGHSRLTLELTDGQTTMYNTTVMLGRHYGVKVDEPYGESTDGSAGRLRRVVGALPRLQRRNTNDGAPSDFCLCYEDGSVAVNLMADDAWQRLASIVTERFASREDRLVAAMALVGQKSVTNLIATAMFENAAGQHTYHTPLHTVFGPMSIIRYGGGPATSRAAVLARLLQWIDDPQTGEAFTTRVVSLTRDGGPRQVERSYEGANAFAAYVQHPGPVAAAAVNCDGSQVILDPTHLIDFDLAPVEQIVSDGDLRSRYAGALGDIFAKLNIDELRRHVPNRLLSRGVYPELAPEEEGEEKPFDLGYTQNNRVIIAGEATNGFVAADGGKSTRDGSVAVTHDAEGLCVTVAVRGVDVNVFDADDRRFERIHVAIDRNHEHNVVFRFMASHSGERHSARELSCGIQKLAKHYSTESWSEIESLSKEAWSSRIIPNDGGYRAKFLIPWDVLGVDGRAELGPVLGLNVWIDSRYPQYAQSFLSPPMWSLPASPFTFADLYLQKPVVTVKRVEYGVPYWGDNVATATLQNETDREVTVVLQSALFNGMDRELHDGEPTSVTISPQSEVETPYEWYADPRHKMAAGTSQVSTLSVRCGDAVVYRGAITFVYCGTPSVYFRYGSDVEPCENPKPGEKDFIAKKVQHISGRIPKFDRLTTRDGAASDFVLRAEDGSVEFNLMESGALYRMAEWVEQRFGTDMDRVLGLFFLGQNPSVLRHMSFGHRLMEGVSPLSVMRGNFAGGGGNCGYHSRAFGGMLAHLTLGGESLVGHTLGIFGHSVNAFGWNESKVIIDNDVGHFMLLPDGSDFATIEHFGNNTDVLSTAGPVDLARYFSFSRHSLPRQGTILNINWPGSFPDGAPLD